MEQNKEVIENNIQITQKASRGSQTTQVAEQNNYYGMTAEQASQIAINLFIDNFPKLQEDAKRIARERADEFCKKVIGELVGQGKNDFSEFSDPDMQFVLNKSQQEYARFGTQNLLELLSDIVVNRANYNNDQYMKILLDEAVEIAKSLTTAHLNYLSLIFFCKHVKFSEITSIDKLDEHLKYICKVLPIPLDIVVSCSFLNMMRLLDLHLIEADQCYAEAYGFEKKLVQEILPEEIKNIPDDYALSPVGIVLAIINAHSKTRYKFRFETWIKAT